MANGRTIYRYRKVADDLRTRIRFGEYVQGEPLQSEQSLSSHYGVNRLTLRKSLHLLEREGWITKKPGCGSFVNNKNEKINLGFGASKTKLLYVGDTEAHFFGRVHKAIIEESQKRNFPMATFSFSVDKKEGEVERDFLDDQIGEADTLILNQHTFKYFREHELCAYKPVIVINHVDEYDLGPVDGASGYQISCSSFDVYRNAVSYLVERGHRDIAFYSDTGINKFREPNSWPNCRKKSFHGFLSGLPSIRDSYMVFGVHVDFNTDEAERATIAWLEGLDRMPTAFVCEGDFRAAKLFRALNKMGLKVPDDVSIVGTGNTPWAEMFTPSLTSVCLGEGEIAKLAVVLSSQISFGTFKKMTVGDRIVERDSVRALEVGNK